MSTGQFCFISGGMPNLVKSRPNDGKVGTGVVPRDVNDDDCLRITRSPGTQLKFKSIFFNNFFYIF